MKEDEKPYAQLITLNEDMLREFTAFKKNAEALTARIGDIESGGKTQSERLEEMARSLEAFQKEYEKADRKVHYPEFDPAFLRWDGSQHSFNRMLQSRPANDSPARALVDAIQEANDEVFLVRMFAEAHAKRQLSMEEMGELKCVKKFRSLCGSLKKEVRALDNATTGEGLEWRSEVLSSRVLAKFALALRAAALFETIPLPSGIWKFPFEASFPDAQRVTETTTMQANPWSTSGVTEAYGSGNPTARAVFDPKKVRAINFTSYEFIEDSVVALIPWLVERMGYALARCREKGLLNGDANAAAAHIDNDLASPFSSGTGPESVINGLRKFYLSKGTVPSVDAGAATPSSATLRSARLMKMGAEFSTDTENLVWFCSPLGSGHMMSNSDVRTLEKYGAGATVVAGEIAKFENSPVVVSGFYKDNLASTGKNTVGGPNTFTSLLCVHRSNFKWGQMPPRQVEVERLPIPDQTVVVVFDRFDFQYVGASADNPVAAVHNIPGAGNATLITNS